MPQRIGKPEHAVMGRQGRVVVPVEVRKALDLAPGTVLTFAVRDGEVIMTTPQAALAKLQAMFASSPRSTDTLASDELVAERHAEARREAEE